MIAGFEVFGGLILGGQQMWVTSEEFEFLIIVIEAFDIR